MRLTKIFRSFSTASVSRSTTSLWSSENMSMMQSIASALTTNSLSSALTSSRNSQIACQPNTYNYSTIKSLKAGYFNTRHSYSKTRLVFARVRHRCGHSRNNSQEVAFVARSTTLLERIDVELQFLVVNLKNNLNTRVCGRKESKVKC